VTDGSPCRFKQIQFSDHTRLALAQWVISESAWRIKRFFFPRLHKLLALDTLRLAGAEDKALLGSNLSADSGAKTRLGLGYEAGLQQENQSIGIGIKAQNPRGLGTESPGRSLLSLLSFRLIRSSAVPLFRRTHISAFNFCMSLFRSSGVAISFQPRGLDPLRAYPCVDERACRINCGSRYTSWFLRTQ